MENKCRDFGERPGCLGDADERYTMRFDDIGEPPIYWCAKCGPESNAINNALTKALETRGPAFVEKFSQAVQEAELDDEDA
jgi:hypothetical protein